MHKALSGIIKNLFKLYIIHPVFVCYYVIYTWI